MLLPHEVRTLDAADVAAYVTKLELEIGALRVELAQRDRRCPVKWANFNRCVRPMGHRELHLTDRGFAWQTRATSGP